MKSLLYITLAVSSTFICTAQSVINDTPTRQFGQLRLSSPSGSPNLVEGRELNGPRGLAFDTSVTPPILYVADTNNNRVLAWINPAAKNPGDVADKVIGQRDFFTTNNLGPGTTFPTGLTTPTAVAVDSRGNLYIADAGNNRILRFPQPFRQTGDLLIPDLIIGQRTLNTRAANQGNGIPSEKTLSSNTGGNVPFLKMAFDTGGNLWVADTYNNRVLRFPTSALAPNALEPAADVVLGQNNFTTNAIASDPAEQQYWRNKAVLDRPNAIAFDSQNRLYVSDNRARVLFYRTPGQFSTPDRVLGIIPDNQQGQPARTFPNEYNVAAFTPTGGGPTDFADGIVLSGTTPFVLDPGDSRIIRFGTPEQWASETTTVQSPAANLPVIGQNDFRSGKPNKGASQADATTLAAPRAAAFLGNDLWIADTGNNRIVSRPMLSGFTFGDANHLLGQTSYNYSSPNMVEGRELYVNSAVASGGVAIDRSSNPPHLYIADSNNNRILGFRDARSVGSDLRTVAVQKPDLVIGQTDLLHTTINYPSGDSDVPSDSGLNLPSALAVDSKGDLYVTDTLNGRVLRFPSPFSQAPGSIQHANLVLGQFSFTTPPVKVAATSNMSSPFGIAILANGSLAVSDLSDNRVLIFKKPTGGDFSNYQAAATVLGQTDFSASIAGSTAAQMRSPRNVALDSSDRLYVADTGNNRVIVFTTVANTVNGASSAFQYSNNINSPVGVTVSQTSGEIWIANTGSNNLIRLPEFQQLQLNPSQQPIAALPSNLPYNLMLDSAENPVVLEGINRVTFYFAKAVTRNGASYLAGIPYKGENSRPLTPGQLAIIGRQGSDFSLTPNSANVPLPTTLSDVQITINGIPAPIYAVIASAIYFQVPNGAPTNGNVDLVVTKVSTGEVLATLNQDLAPANPGFYASNAQGFGLAAATNDDGTVNTPGNPVGRGKVITFYLTGFGFLSGAIDGQVPNPPISTPTKPTMRSNNGPITIPPADILYSGTSFFPGVWQINMRVSELFPPAANNVIAITYNDVDSTRGPTGTLVLTFATK